LHGLSSIVIAEHDANPQVKIDFKHLTIITIITLHKIKDESSKEKEQNPYE
jgi:hypothetical protein